MEGFEPPDRASPYETLLSTPTPPRVRMHAIHTLIQIYLGSALRCNELLCVT